MTTEAAEGAKNSDKDPTETGLGLGEFRRVRAKWEAQEGETIAILKALADSLPVDENDTANMPSAELVDKAAQLGDSWKALHVQISKFGKLFEKKINRGELVDVVDELNPEEEAQQNAAITQSILQHLYREGSFAAADMLASEMGGVDAEEMKRPFVQMHNLIRALAEHHIEPAIQWAEEHAHQLGEIGLELRFQLHSLAYIDILKAAHGPSPSSNPLTAMQYAKRCIVPFVSKYPSEVETLMGALAFTPNLISSPYQSILLNDLWKGCEEALVAAYCSVLGLPRESSLRLCVDIGSAAWPKLSKVLAMMKSKPGVEWALAPSQELPVEIDSEGQQRFHSVFVCPVLRQQTTEANPPMMMSCGHVICHEALNRLSRGNPNHRIKCPYCPAESTAAMAMKIVF